jgi:hypothetical protein
MAKQRTSLLATVIAACALWLAPRLARADVAAGYLQGHGGLSSNDGTTRASTSASSTGAGLTPGLGFQVGARLLFLEGYYDRTAFSSAASVSRGIIGVRSSLGTGDLRLVLRGGGGMIFEHGGAITAAALGLGDRRGVVARAGVALEKRLTHGEFVGGIALDGEAFSLQKSVAAISERVQGGDVFLSLHVRFELGI